MINRLVLFHFVFDFDMQNHQRFVYTLRSTSVERVYHYINGLFFCQVYEGIVGVNMIYLLAHASVWLPHLMTVFVLIQVARGSTPRQAYTRC